MKKERLNIGDLRVNHLYYPCYIEDGEEVINAAPFILSNNSRQFDAIFLLFANQRGDFFDAVSDAYFPKNIQYREFTHKELIFFKTYMLRGIKACDMMLAFYDSLRHHLYDNYDGLESMMFDGQEGIGKNGVLLLLKRVQGNSALWTMNRPIFNTQKSVARDVDAKNYLETWLFGWWGDHEKAELKLNEQQLRGLRQGLNDCLENI